MRIEYLSNKELKRVHESQIVHENYIVPPITIKKLPFHKAQVFLRHHHHHINTQLVA